MSERQAKAPTMSALLPSRLVPEDTLNGWQGPNLPNTKNYAPPPDSLRGRMGNVLMQSIAALGGFMGLPMSGEGDRAALLGELLAAGMPLVGGVKALRGVTGAKRAAEVLDEGLSDTVKLYHGSPSSSDLVVSDKGLFGGVFASGDKTIARSHSTDAGRIHAFDVQRKDILTQHALSNVDATKINKTLKSSLGDMDDSELDAVRSIVVNDENIFNSSLDEDRLKAIFRSNDLGEAGWEAQRIRGKIAKELGYKAIEMSDEHGVTHLLLPGNIPKRTP